MIVSAFRLLAIIAIVITPLESVNYDKKGREKRGNKIDMSGSYCATWKTLIAARSEVVQSQGCFIFETSKADPDLFTYKQCWYRKSNRGEKFKDVAGGVVTRRTKNEISFISAEVAEVQDPEQAVIGAESGYKKSNGDFVLFGAQPGLGLAYKIVLHKVARHSLDDNACKLGRN